LKVSSIETEVESGTDSRTTKVAKRDIIDCMMSFLMFCDKMFL